MAVQTVVPIEEYLNTSYSPDCEYKDGAVLERNVGTEPHSWLQAQLAAYFNRRRKQWKVRAYTELRIKVRESWYALPDVCVYNEPAPKDRYPSVLPLLWIEILSPSDVMIDVWGKANELISCGVPYVWIIDPETLESELRMASGVTHISDKTLSLPGTSIVIPLEDVLNE
jgi:Uma2 family endonuclease